MFNGTMLLDSIKGLAKCQGLYSRLLSDLYDEYKTDVNIIDVLQSIIIEEDMTGTLDFILWFEN